jgi:hypothetical protein
MLHRLKAVASGLRLKAGLVRRSADSGHLEVIVRFGGSLVFDALHPDLIGYVTTARDPVAARPHVLTPIAFSQNAELRQQSTVKNSDKA